MLMKMMMMIKMRYNYDEDLFKVFDDHDGGNLW